MLLRAHFLLTAWTQSSHTFNVIGKLVISFSLLCSLLHKWQNLMVATNIGYTRSKIIAGKHTFFHKVKFSSNGSLEQIELCQLPLSQPALHWDICSAHQVVGAHNSAGKHRRTLRWEWSAHCYAMCSALLSKSTDCTKLDFPTYFSNLFFSALPRKGLNKSPIQPALRHAQKYFISYSSTSWSSF